MPCFPFAVTVTVSNLVPVLYYLATYCMTGGVLQPMPLCLGEG